MSLMVMLFSSSIGISILMLADAAAETAGDCRTASDCQLNGVCLEEKCHCDPAWSGDTCASLVLTEPGVLAYGGPTSNVTSWGGGPPVLDPATGKWVLYVTEIAEHCGLSEWQHQSTVVMATADRPEGPFVREKLVIPTQAHNPYYAFDPASKTHLIFHIGGGDNPESKDNKFKHCTDGTTPNSSSAILDADTEPAPPPAEYSVPYLHASKSLAGPFTRVNVSLPPGHSPMGWGYDNPAPFIFPNGTVLMLTRKYNGTAAKLHIVPHDTIWLVRAPSFEGPYELVFDRPVFESEQFNEEDPCIWQDHRGNFHALFHFTHGHAWSVDGISWEWGGGKSAWTSTLKHADGSVETLHDAERPRVWVNPRTRMPELLFVASGGPSQPTKIGLGQRGFTVAQKIRTQGKQ